MEVTVPPAGAGGTAAFLPGKRGKAGLWGLVCGVSTVRVEVCKAQ